MAAIWNANEKFGNSWWLFLAVSGSHCEIFQNHFLLPLPIPLTAIHLIPDARFRVRPVCPWFEPRSGSHKYQRLSSFFGLGFFYLSHPCDKPFGFFSIIQNCSRQFCRSSIMNWKSVGLSIEKRTSESSAWGITLAMPRRRFRQSTASCCSLMSSAFSR